jgi:hypothetical protein
MDGTYIKPSGQRGPAVAVGRRGNLSEQLRRQIEQGLLEEVRDQARVDPMRDHRRWRARAAAAECERRLAQRVVRAQSGGHRGIVIAPDPRLDAGVQVQDLVLLAPGDEVDTAYIDRQVQQEIPWVQVGPEHVLIILTGDRMVLVGHTVARGNLGTVGACTQNADLLWRDADVPQQQRQHALPDAAKADYQ